MISAALLHTAALGLGAAIVWGGGDFSGGMAVKRAGGSLAAALRVVLLSHATSLTLLVVAALAHRDAPPPRVSVLWALCAGLAGGSSVLTFYLALAEGEMGSSAAISGLLAAAIPAIVAVATEGSPGTLPLAGFLLAAGAIWLIAAGNTESHSSRRITSLAIVSGCGFGIYFVALRMASRAGLFWPMSCSRLGSISVCLFLLLVTSRRAAAVTQPHTPVLTRRVVSWVLATALLDTGGNLFYMAATRTGRLDIAAVLASLYPASTILLAAWVLGQRPTLRQGIGMLIAGAAVVLITL